MANKCMEWGSTYVIREMLMKVAMRLHYTPIRMTKIWNSDSTMCWQGCGATGRLLDCWWESRMVQLLWKTVSCKMKQTLLTTWFSNHASWYLPGRVKQFKCTEQPAHGCFAAKTVCPCKRKPVVQDCQCLGEQMCLILGLILGGHCWHKPQSYPLT